jgi:uncharacterized FlgJ-related protein
MDIAVITQIVNSPASGFIISLLALGYLIKQNQGQDKTIKQKDDHINSISEAVTNAYIENAKAIQLQAIATEKSVKASEKSVEMADRTLRATESLVAKVDLIFSDYRKHANTTDT